MDKKVFIIGVNGLIGGALYRVFSQKGYAVFGADKDVTRNDFAFVDITNKDSVEKEMKKIQPDVLLLTAALSHVDYCEEFPEESEMVNIQGLLNILNAIDQEKTTLVYFSSDYIFDGVQGPYKEDDTPSPLNVYGKQKLMAEQLIAKRLKNYLIVRTTWVYGPEIQEKNFALSLQKRLQGTEQVKVPFDQIGSPTYSENLADIIEELVRKEKKGTYNIAGPELIDRYSFAREICNVFGLSEQRLVSVSTVQLGQKAKRPLRAGLKMDKVKKEVSVPLVDYKNGLSLLKKWYE